MAGKRENRQTMNISLGFLFEFKADIFREPEYISHTRGSQKIIQRRNRTKRQ
jgi:hypothetical protein